MGTVVRAITLLLVAGIIVTAASARAASGSSEQALADSWKLTERSVDAEGNPCPFVPDSMEFSDDQTMTMSNMPDNRVRYKTAVTPDERTAVETRLPALKGMPLLLVKPMPQMEWKNTPIVYGYSLSEKMDVLTLIVPGWSPARFQRAK